MSCKPKDLSPKPRAYISKRKKNKERKEGKKKKARHGVTHLYSQHWRGSDRKAPGAYWSASLTHFVSSGSARGSVFKKQKPKSMDCVLE